MRIVNLLLILVELVTRYTEGTCDIVNFCHCFRVHRFTVTLHKFLLEVKVLVLLHVYY